MKFLAGLSTVVFLMLGMYYHDYQISRRWEIIFFGLATASALCFEWLIRKC